MPTLEEPIPDATHPSDHVPIAFKMGFRKLTDLLEGSAVTWVSVVLAA